METITLVPGFSSGAGGSMPSIFRPISTKTPSGVTDTTVPSKRSPAAWCDCSNCVRMSPKEVSAEDASGESGALGWGMREKPESLLLCHRLGAQDTPCPPAGFSWQRLPLRQHLGDIVVQNEHHHHHEKHES